MAMNMPTKNCD